MEHPGSLTYLTRIARANNPFLQCNAQCLLADGDIKCSFAVSSFIFLFFGFVALYLMELTIEEDTDKTSINKNPRRFSFLFTLLYFSAAWIFYGSLIKCVRVFFCRHCCCASSALTNLLSPSLPTPPSLAARAKRCVPDTLSTQTTVLFIHIFLFHHNPQYDDQKEIIQFIAAASIMVIFFLWVIEELFNEPDQHHAGMDAHYHHHEHHGPRENCLHQDIV